ncbi:MAG: SGNH/GDSL hydrolase family protein, partial [Candidatus Binatia bacterium]
MPFERVKYEVRYGHYSGNVVGRFLEYDPALTFRNRRGASFPDVNVEINSLGLRGPEISIEKPEGVLRVLCLGDSCTFGGPHPYPEMLQVNLDRRAPRRFQVLNGGVIGYTSVHGLAWLENELERLRPDVVTLYFGWNDMWREKDSAVREWFRSRVEGRPTPLVRSRLWETASRSLVFLQHTFGFAELQVPPEKYGAALRAFARIGRANGFKPIYVTAPSGFTGDHTPEWLVRQGFVARGDSAPRLRRTYNQVVAEVARLENLPLADAAA